VRPEDCSADGKCQDFSGTVLPCVTDAQRAQPFTYDAFCLSNCDRFGPSHVCERMSTEEHGCGRVVAREFLWLCTRISARIRATAHIMWLEKSCTRLKTNALQEFWQIRRETLRASFWLEVIALLNPRIVICPVFSSSQDSRGLLLVYRSVLIFIGFRDVTKGTLPTSGLGAVHFWARLATWPGLFSK
jgi:hypothetical protein